MPLTSEVRIVTLGVADLERSSRFYREAFGYESRARGEVDRRLHAAWRLPDASRVRYEILARPGSTTGMLRLLAFARPGERIWGEYERVQDHGLFALNLRVPDCRATWSTLEAAGARLRSPPTHWAIDPSVAAWDSQCFDPDGVLLDVYETEPRDDRARALFPPFEGRAHDVETVALHVADAGRSRDFYAALGFEVYFDRTIAGMAGFFHLPPEVGLRDVNMVMQDRPHVGCIEIVEYVDYPGEPLGARAAPPNLGLLSMSFEVADLAEVEYVVRGRGARPVTPGHAVASLPPFGEVALWTCLGPDGEALEFFHVADAID